MRRALELLAVSLRAPWLARWLALALSAACSDTRGDDGASVLVLAAASTGDVVEELARRFEAEHGVPVVVSAAGTSALAAQVLAGAPADLLLAAHAEWADVLEERGLVLDARTLLTNELVLAVPSDVPTTGERAVTGLADLLDDLLADLLDGDRVIAVAGERVPAGVYAREALAKHGFDAGAASGALVVAQNVRGVLAWLERGEVDAGVIYASDAAASPRVRVVHRFASEDHAPIRYPLLLLAQRSGHGEDERDFARRFFEYLASEPARALFVERGFRSALP